MRRIWIWMGSRHRTLTSRACTRTSETRHFITVMSPLCAAQRTARLARARFPPARHGGTNGAPETAPSNATEPNKPKPKQWGKSQNGPPFWPEMEFHARMEWWSFASHSQKTGQAFFCPKCRPASWTATPIPSDEGHRHIKNAYQKRM